MNELSPDPSIFSHVSAFCLFIGYPYSGHSLVGSILDAHPNVVISHELHIGRLLKRGYPKEKIFPMIVLNSIRFAREGRTWNNYSYLIPDEWNGRFSEIKVIGDKKGGKSTKFFTKKSEIFDLVDASFGVPVKYIHVMRNPYDLISTLFRRRKRSGADKMRQMIDSCFLHIGHVEALRSQVPAESWLDVYHENLLAEPEQTIRALFGFFDLETPDSMIANCRKIMFKTPHKSRLNISWSQEDIDYVAMKLKNTRRFSSYSYHS